MNSGGPSFDSMYSSEMSPSRITVYAFRLPMVCFHRQRPYSTAAITAPMTVSAAAPNSTPSLKVDTSPHG